MESKVKVSIIVPVYKTEIYLRNCLDSLVDQTLKEIEIIVVNDGSPDQSSKIIEEYLITFPHKVKAIHKQNGGLGDARNAGLKIAQGEFIGFVDSDDWVELNMFETLYNVAKEGHDLVICDCITYYDHAQSSYISKGFRGKKFDRKEAIKYATDPAYAWNKLYKRDLFKRIKFSKSWYEDLATIPILMSYTKSPVYIEKPLYYYRQRSDSISNSSDLKTLGVIDAWDRIQTKTNPSFKEEIDFAVARSIAIFIEFKPQFSKDFLLYAKKQRKMLKSNKYYQTAIRKNEIRNLLSSKPIPKKIHYCWFGQQEKSELAKKCIQSWKDHLPNYEIYEWNETNCDLLENNYVKEAYNAKKWAFVADYFRLKALFEHGGIYLDTDVEITRNLDRFRKHQTFFAFETSTSVQTGIIGAVKGVPVIKKLLDEYKTARFQNSDGSFDLTTNVLRVTRLLTSTYQLSLTGKRQVLAEDIIVYPANKLTIDINDGKNYAIHHFNCSWWEEHNGPTWKEIIVEQYNAEQRE